MASEQSDYEWARTCSPREWAWMTATVGVKFYDDDVQDIEKFTQKKNCEMILDAKEFNIPYPEKILPVLLYSRNEIFKRPLPFPNMFINHQFEMDGIIIKGISLKAVRDVESDAQGNMLEIDLNPDWNDEALQLQVYFNCVVSRPDLKPNFEGYYCNYALGRYDEIIKHKEDEIDLIPVAKKIDLLVCNLLDFLNQPEVTIEERHYEDNAEKRMARGKCPKAKIKDFVIVEHWLKKYPQLWGENQGRTFSHRFWIRGHFRSMNSSFYKAKKGARIWIAPYIKGHGLLINKKYIMKTNKLENVEMKTE